MKITDPDIIKNGEKDLIEAVRDDLDLNAVKEILKKRMAAAALSSKGGEIVVYNNEIAYRLDFDIQLSGSLMFDRQGNYIPESAQSIDDDLNNPGESGDPENIISDDLDLDDINLDETLEEVAPQTLLNSDDKTDTDDNEPFEEEELNIDLPEYDLDDASDPENEISETNEDDNIETELLDDEDSDVQLEDLDPLLDEPEMEAETDQMIENDIVDDDISDILQESRDFWDQKKDS